MSLKIRDWSIRIGNIHWKIVSKDERKMFITIAIGLMIPIIIFVTSDLKDSLTSWSFWAMPLPTFEAGYLYFFSSLAQAAASFAGLAAIFAVYRMQIKEDVLLEFFSRVMRWLTTHKYIVGQMDRKTVLLELQEINSGRKNFEYENGPKEAAIYLKDFEDLTNFHSKLPYYLAKPLKYWAMGFFLSLICLLVFEVQILRRRIVLWMACFILLWVTYQALVRTRRFIQRCLGSDLRSDAIKS